MTATCDRLHCLLLGWEYSPESISIEGGSDDRILRLPVIGILVHAPIGWVLLETGMHPRDGRRLGTGGDDLPVRRARSSRRRRPAARSAARRTASPSMTSRWPRSATCTSTTPAACVTSRAHVPVAVQRRELEFATTRAGLPEAYVRGDYELDPAIEWIVVDGDAELTPGIDAALHARPHAGPHVLPRAHG